MRLKTRLLFLGAIPIAALPLGRDMRPVVVIGDSMSPTYHSGQVLWMRRFHAGMPLQTGDIVVFRHDGEVAIKRVMAMPGADLPRFRFRGGTYLMEDDVPPNLYACIERLQARGIVVRDDVSVPDGCLYAVGDNRNASLDSRDFGPVALEEVMGVIPKATARPRGRLLALAR